jgi:hypothetical protein
MAMSYDLERPGMQWLANPRIFVRPLPYAGRLGLFLVSEGVVAAALQKARTRAPSKRGG